MNPRFYDQRPANTQSPLDDTLRQQHVRAQSSNPGSNRYDHRLQASTPPQFQTEASLQNVQIDYLLRGQAGSSQIPSQQPSIQQQFPLRQRAITPLPMNPHNPYRISAPQNASPQPPPTETSGYPVARPSFLNRFEPGQPRSYPRQYPSVHSQQHYEGGLTMNVLHMQPSFTHHFSAYNFGHQAIHLAHVNPHALHPAHFNPHALRPAHNEPRALLPAYHVQEDVLEHGKQQYQLNLRAAYAAIIAGKVSEARELIVNLTRWLLSSIEPLGLHFDNEQENEQRLQFWREFNQCWEALGLKQLEIAEDALRTKQTPVDMISKQQIIIMVDGLIRQCDEIETHGLVDYEMGVWEEQIVGVFMSCLDVHEELERRDRGDVTAKADDRGDGKARADDRPVSPSLPTSEQS